MDAGLSSAIDAHSVTLDEEHAGKLANLAERMHVQEGTLARSLLSTALDDANPDAARITEVLDAIPAPGSARRRAWRRPPAAKGRRSTTDRQGLPFRQPPL
jgi:hypothetical protein